MRGTTHDSLVGIAAMVLSANPAASMQDVAEEAGISRATLHRRFANREDLVFSIARLAISEIEEISAHIDERQLTGLAAIEALIEVLVPLAPRFGFLMSQYCLESNAEAVELSQQVFNKWTGWVEEGQRRNEIRVDLPARWVVSSLHGLVASVYDGVREGLFGQRDAPRLVRLTLLGGIATTPFTHQSFQPVSNTRSSP